MSSQLPVWEQPGKGYKFKRSWTYLPRVFPYLKPYWRLGVSSIALLVVSAVLVLAEPWPLGIVFDSVLKKHPVPHLGTGLFHGNRIALLVFAVGAGLVIALTVNGLAVVSEYVNTKLQQKMALDFRADLFEHAQRLPLSFHDQTRRDTLVGRFVFETQAVGSIPVSLPAIAQSVITLVGMIWIMFRLDATLAWVALSVLPFIYYSITYYAIHIEPSVRKVKYLEWRGLGLIMQSFSMLRVIFTFGREPYEHRRFRNVSESAVDARVKLTVRQTLFSFAVNLLTAVGTALVMGIGAYHVLRGELSAGELVVILGYITAVYTPLQTISAAFTTLQDEVVALQLAFQLLDTEPDIKDAPDAVVLDRAQGRVEFRGVSFSYTNRQRTLTDVNFEVQPGDTVAIVGPTGAGKSTLVSLIPRLYEATRGEVLIDGIDTRTLTLQSLRKQVAVVLQEPLLFSGSIAENVRYGRLEASMREIVEATKAAGAHDFVMALPNGYDTQLGEGGVRLSGGERQRIAIARAFLKDAPILILDEPTSSVDSKTESVILDALDRLMVGRTTFIIAHRLSTIRHADLIVAMDRGRVAEVGTHEGLLEREGLYRQLHEAQIGRRERKAAHSGPASLPRKRIVVLGMMSKMPVAGVVWQTVHYLLGLKRLGYDVFYVEEHGGTPAMLMREGDPDGSRAAADFIAGVMARFDLGDRWAFHARHADGRCYGMSEQRLRNLYATADLIINLHGGTEPLPEHGATGRLVYLETDPVQLQVELLEHQQRTIDFLQPHVALFTFGENYGSPDCKLPLVEGFTFRPTRQPVVLDLWRGEEEARDVFSTIGSWRQSGKDVTLDGSVYGWSKHEEFEKFLDLPSRSARAFELALARCPAEDRSRLERAGWKVRDALELSSDLDRYRRYIATSRAEFTVAKDQNIRLRTGWFSDRSATYLAAGRPVVTQETGFSRILPTGEGLFAFESMDDILGAIEAIDADPRRHRRAAREIATEYFAATKVLRQLLDTVGLSSMSVQKGRRPPPVSERVATIPADLDLVPASRWPTTLSEEAVDAIMDRPLPRPGAGTPGGVGASVVVVTFDNLVFTRLCLESLVANTADPRLEVVVVDNGSTDGTRDYLGALSAADPRVRVIANEANEGFSAAVNRGLAQAGGGVLVVLNNDTMVPPGWLGRLTRHLSDRDVGLVGPLTNRSGNEQEIVVPYRTYAEFLEFCRTRRAEPRLEDVRTLVMFCAAMRRDVYERVGPLDERFVLGMFEDDDYAMRMRAAGLRVVVATDAVVHHFGQASIGKLAATGEYGPLFHDNRRRFEEKWGVTWESHHRRPDPAYDRLVERVRALVQAATPPRARVLVVSNGDEEIVTLAGRQGAHFPQGPDRGYAGYRPADGDAAVEHLEELRAAGAEYLVVPETARWWLDHYAALREHLDRTGRRVVDEEGVGVLFALSQAPSFWMTNDEEGAAT